MGTNQQQQVAPTVFTTGGSRQQYLPPGVRQKGNRFEGRFKVGGKQYAVTGATPEQAYQALQQLKEQVTRGVDPLPPR